MKDWTKGIKRAWTSFHDIEHWPFRPDFEQTNFRAQWRRFFVVTIEVGSRDSWVNDSNPIFGRTCAIIAIKKLWEGLEFVWGGGGD